MKIKNETLQLLALYYTRLYKNTVKLTDLQNVYTVHNSFSKLYSTPGGDAENASMSEEQLKAKYEKIKWKKLKGFYRAVVRFTLTAGTSLDPDTRPEVSPIHYILGAPGFALFMMKMAFNSVIDAVGYAINIRRYGQEYNQYNDPNEFRLGYFGKRSPVSGVFKIAISWALLIEPLRLLWQAFVVAPFMASYASNKYGAYFGVAVVVALFIALSFTTFGVGGLVALPALTEAVSGFASVYYAGIVKWGAMMLITGAMFSASSVFFSGVGNGVSYLGKVTGLIARVTSLVSKVKTLLTRSKAVDPVVAPQPEAVSAATTQVAVEQSSVSLIDDSESLIRAEPAEIEMVPIVAAPNQASIAASLNNASAQSDKRATQKPIETTWYNDAVETVKAHPYIAIGAGIIGFKVTGAVIGLTLAAKAITATAALLKVSGAALSVYSGTQVAANPHLFTRSAVGESEPDQEEAVANNVTNARH